MVRRKEIREAGYFLLEFIVSLLLVSLMLLGFEAQTLLNIKQAEIISVVSVAHRQIELIADRLETSKMQNDAAFIDHWNQENKILLPNGTGKITGTYPHYLISIAWGSYNTSCNITSINHQSGCLITHL